MKISTLNKKSDLNAIRKPITEQLYEAALELKAGGVVAYPTESCFGLGCYPKNHLAIQRILKIKHRATNNGLIIIANDLDQLSPYIEPLPDNLMDKMLSSWPGPTTWLVPAADWVPKWLTGQSDKIGIRVPEHKIARRLCKTAQMALVSTSVNQKGYKPLRFCHQFSDSIASQLDYIIDAGIGVRRLPSTILDITSGEVIR